MIRSLLILFLFIPITILAQEVIVMADSTLEVCDVTFTDTGGEEANYGNSEDLTMTFTSPNAGEELLLSFSSFNLESGFDSLYVYDGTDETAPVIGELSGTSLPEEIISSGGALTFRFTSDGSATRSGWEAAITCNSGEPFPPDPVTFSDTTTSSVLVSWVAPDDNGTAITGYTLEQRTGNDGTYEVIYAGTELTHTATNLGSGIYFFRVKATNSIGDSEYSSEVPFALGMVRLGDAALVETCDTVFVDTGGFDSNYSNGEDTTITFIASGEGNLLRISFISFDLESGWDNLYIYDGVDTEAPLIDTFTGTTLPGDITATDGELTIRFTSDGSTTRAGWAATITCVPIPPLPPAPVTFGETTATSAVVNWTAPEDNGVVITGYTLEQKAESDVAFEEVYTGADLTFTATGLETGTTYFFRVKATSANGDSEYSEEASVTPGLVKIGDEVSIGTCDAAFSDSGGIDADYSNNEDQTITFIPSNEGNNLTVSFSSFDLESGWDYLYVYDGTDTDAPLIGSFTGITLPGDITATGGELTFRFTSDFSGTSGGWRASITCVPAPPPPVQPEPVTFSEISSTSVVVSWVAPEDNGSVITGYTLEQKTENDGTYQQVYTGANLTYTATGLETGTTYFFRVSATNANGDSDYSEEASVIPGLIKIGEEPVVASCDLLFTDAGGPEGAYGYFEDRVITFAPENEGDNMMITFAFFELDEGFDYLYVYDGLDTNAPLLAELTGSELPDDLVATGGTLTFRFVSDGFRNGQGWEASIQCVTPVGLTPTWIHPLSIYPNPATDEYVTIALPQDVQGNAFDFYMVSVDGKKLKTSWHKTGTHSIQLNVKKFAPGVYLAHINCQGDRVFVGRVIIKK